MSRGVLYSAKCKSESPRSLQRRCVTLIWWSLVDGVELAFAPEDAFHAETAQEKGNREIYGMYSPRSLAQK